ncbi:LPD38 domain-containing protein [Cribrihabitans pelagius]|uniref:LPD38 domain-containing protein n=1 Tax=Cribrihabitans pelagius TaxID=1765746 RepID=UPI003B5A62DC
MPPKALSLNGELGLAFGARGSGRKAAAHYEPGEVVINLTKGQGAGSLAHEWWHAMDHYFARQGGKSALLLTEVRTSTLSDGIRPELVAAFDGLMSLVRKGGLKVRSAVADQRKSKPFFATMPEMTARAFESYAEARRNGWSKADAASLAKNLTVNFNRRGEIGASMHAWSPFANAANQGSHVILKAMRSKQVQGIVGGMILFGFANDLLAAMLSAEDEDGELEYDQLPAYKSERNIIVATPLTEEGYVTISPPYGCNVFFFAGQQLGKIVRGVKSPAEAAGQLLQATIGAYSPISGEDGFSMLAPTVPDFANEFDNNRDWLGRPIRPENPYGDYGPQSYKEYNASAPSRALAQGLNTATGGSPLEPGILYVSPEYIDRYFKFMTGGAGRFAGKMYGLAERTAEGTLGETEAYEVPIARVLYTESGDFLNQNRYFEFRDAVREARAQEKRAEEIGYPMTQEMKDLNALWVSLRQADKRRNAISGQMDAIYADETLSGREREAKLRPLKEARNEVYLQFNKRFIERIGPQAE